jgi:uncharacterized protein
MKILALLPVQWTATLDPRSRRLLLAPQRALAACRILGFPRKLATLWGMKFMGPYFRAQRKRDAFFFLTHEFYLSKYFSVRQRIDCAIDHYRFEEQRRTPAYRRAVYQLPHVLMLWQQVVEGVHYAITLCATEDTRHEGDLSVCCLADNKRICRVAFSYVDQRVFGLPSQRTMFVTRNQTYLCPEQGLFRRAFRQNSPPYFCIAAVSGIAMASGMHTIFVVKADAQIAYAEKYANGFRNSYSALWLRLGAQDSAGRHAYSLAIPLPLAPLSAVSHRNRAIARRRNWLDIALGTRRIMLTHSASHGPPPIGAGESELLPVLDIQALGRTRSREYAARLIPGEFA